MNRYRILSGALLSVGLMNLLMGLEQTGQAQCNEVTIMSKRCAKAHADAPVANASGAYCEMQGNDCVAAADTDCVDRWGVGYSGKCDQLVLGTTTTYTCHEDAFQIFLSVPWYTAECVEENSECNCVWTKGTNTQQMQICDCYDEAEE